MAESWQQIAAEHEATVTQAPSMPGQPKYHLLMQDPHSVQLKRDAIAAGGHEQLQLIMDFDFTLTKFRVDGKRGCTCHGVIGDCNLLTEDYHKLSQALYEHYYPMEVDRSLTHEQRVASMVEWVDKSHAAMLTAGLTRAKLVQAVRDANIELRAGYAQLMRRLHTLQVPLLIFSAGIADVLEEVLRQHSDTPLPQHAHIVSNRMQFDEQTGAFQGFTGDLYHVFNKQAASIKHAPYFKHDEIDARHNVVLCGDSLGDVSMSNGIAAQEVLRIGFLNDKIDERLTDYLATYDVVIIGEDAPLDYLNDLLSELQ